MFCRRIIWTNSGEREVKSVLTGLLVTLSEVPKSWKMMWNFWKQSENISLPGTWIYIVQQPFFLPSSIFSFGEQSPEKGELNKKKKMAEQPYVADLRLTEFFAPLWSLVSLHGPALPCSKIWEKRPKLNLTPELLTDIKDTQPELNKI